ncbi:hypothetical protein PVL30_001678 [Lodderomyces elongisporus]|uniref:uncharacterized protein n=1 Tax=Lodderomyces elongisporus TaxID=36914 RepID=UPI002924B481|nr:uncharacterized protein PVL30_001678 [Lodderomyces elongisporus]WLF77955.1 hypothetical protein PVL30_001678 [Lodderomyces elongisporus]
MPLLTNFSDLRIPTKRVYDSKNNRILNVIRHLHEDNGIKANEDANENLEPANIDSAKWKVHVCVKICALSYPQDFPKSNKHQIGVIPGKRMIVKKFDESQIYLVFPYTNCKVERVEQHRYKEENRCHRQNQNQNQNQCRSQCQCQCQCNLIYGEDLDGGLQSSIYVPRDLLIPIPTGVSLHDVCFIWDILLPFYIHFQHAKNNFSSICIILNNVEREVNEILLVLNHFNYDQGKITITDFTKRRPSMLGKYDCVFCFNPHQLTFAESYCKSTGLESIRNRYCIFIDSPIPSTHSTDKTYVSMRLTYEDQPKCTDLLNILADINTNLVQQQENKGDIGNFHDNSSTNKSTAKSLNGPDKNTGQNTGGNTGENTGQNTGQNTGENTFDTVSLKSSFASTNSSDGSSEIDFERKKMMKSTGKNGNNEDKEDKKDKSHKKRHYTWLWCDEDVVMPNTDDKPDITNSALLDVDALEKSFILGLNKNLSLDGATRRVCYFNKKIKSSSDLNFCII